MSRHSLPPKCQSKQIQVLQLHWRYMQTRWVNKFDFPSVRTGIDTEKHICYIAYTTFHLLEERPKEQYAYASVWYVDNCHIFLQDSLLSHSLCTESSKLHSFDSPTLKPRPCLESTLLYVSLTSLHLGWKNKPTELDRITIPSKSL